MGNHNYNQQQPNNESGVAFVERVTVQKKWSLTSYVTAAIKNDISYMNDITLLRQTKRRS